MLHFNRICRLCMDETRDELLSLYSSRSFSVKVMSLVPLIKLAPGDGLPEQVCSRCVYQVIASYNFKKQCERADAILKQLAISEDQAWISEERKTENFEVEGEIAVAEETGVNCVGSPYHYSVDSDNTGEARLRVEASLSAPESESKKTNLCYFNNVNKEQNIIKVSDIHKNIAYSCDICGKAYKWKKNIKNHLLKHSGERPFSCGTCGKLFTSKDALSLHTAIHTGEKRYCCEACGMRFRQKSAFNLHCVKHANEVSCKQKSTFKLHNVKQASEKQYCCEVCGMCFKQKASLDIHCSKHYEIKPYVCDHCGSKFANRVYLKRHMLMHSSVQPHLCEICGKGFYHRQDVKIHMASHSEKKPHECHVCGKSFSKHSRLKDHMTTHSGKRPFSCPDCDKSFVRKDHLKYHLNAVHGKQQIKS